MELGSALANDDIAGDDELAPEAIDAEPLCLAVTPVLSLTATFFMRHFSALLCYYTPAMLSIRSRLKY